MIRQVYHLLQRVMPDRLQHLRAAIYRLRDWRCGRLDTPFLQVRPSGRRAPALLVADSEVTISHAGTGIPRVTEHVLAELRARTRVIAVRNVSGTLTTARQYDCFLQGRTFDGVEQALEFLPGDRLFLLDASWLQEGDFRRILQRAARCKVPVYGMVHDMFPVLHPHWFASAVFQRKFTAWYRMLFQVADIMFCVSKTTEADIRTCCQRWQVEMPRTLVTYVGVSQERAVGAPRASLRRFFTGAPVFLMAGTVEERKQQWFVYQALQPLLAAHACKLLLIGHAGRGAAPLARVLAGRAAQDAPVLWLQDAADGELAWAYAHAEALLMASQAEGFGLPVIEAAKYSCPVICSDLPIFREIAGEEATFFPVGDADGLRSVIGGWLQGARKPAAQLRETYTWQSVADRICRGLSL